MRRTMKLLCWAVIMFSSALACQAVVFGMPLSAPTDVPLAEPAVIETAVDAATSTAASHPTTAPPTPTAVVEIATALPEPSVPAPELSLSLSEDYGQAARQHMEFLANEIGERWPGTEASYQAAEYVAETFEAMGYAVEVQNFTFYDEDVEADLEASNLIAVHEGLSPRQIIVGAHYDSGDEADGADDNASGIGVLLEVAGLLRGVDTPYTVVLIAFGAEENDLDGSRYYVKQMRQAEIADTAAMINLDSLASGDLTYVYGDTGPGTLYEWVLNLAGRANLPLEGKPAAELDYEDGTPCECADYHAFQQAGIPFIFFEATNWNVGDQDGWTQVDPRYGDEGAIIHTRYDTIDYIESTFPGRIDQHLNLFVTLLVNALQTYK